MVFLFQLGVPLCWFNRGWGGQRVSVRQVRQVGKAKQAREARKVSVVMGGGGCVCEEGEAG